MKYIFILTAFIFNVSFAQAVDINEKKIPYIDILAIGEKVELNKIPTDFEKNLGVNIYSLPSSKENNCFPESHGVCKLSYYITSSQLDDSPMNKLHSLGDLGEVIDYRWESTDLVDTAVIFIKVRKYTKEALSYNKLLKNKITTYKLIINATSIKFEKAL